MTDPKNKKRSSPISYRPPEGTRSELFVRQLKSGLCMNAFITEAIFGMPSPRQVRRPPIEKAELARLLALAANIRDQLDALQNDPSIPERDDQLDRALDDLNVLRSAIFSALGRTPCFLLVHSIPWARTLRRTS